MLVGHVLLGDQWPAGSAVHCTMCTQVGDKTVSNEEKNPAIVVLLILVDEANMMKKKRRIEISWKSFSFQ